MRTAEEKREYAKRWREAHPDYHKRWKAEHPRTEYERKKRHDEYAAKIEELKKEPEKLAAYRAQNCANAKAYKERLRADPEKWRNYLDKRREYRKRQRERERAERLHPSEREREIVRALEDMTRDPDDIL